MRHRAKECRIDAERIGVTGRSAGGHLSLWVVLHDNAANLEAIDPVDRQSSRVACAVSFAGPTDWSLLSELEHKHPAYRQLFGYQPGAQRAQEGVSCARKAVLGFAQLSGRICASSVHRRALSR